MKLKLITIFILCLLLNSCGDACPERKCGDFSTQAEAQKTFDSDPGCYSNLDRDNDGIPCENN